MIETRNYFSNFYKVKKLLALSVIENEANAQLLNEIVKTFLPYESNHLELIYDNDRIIKELSHQK